MKKMRMIVFGRGNIVRDETVICNREFSDSIGNPFIEWTRKSPTFTNPDRTETKITRLYNDHKDGFHFFDIEEQEEQEDEELALERKIFSSQWSIEDVDFVLYNMCTSIDLDNPDILSTIEKASCLEDLIEYLSDGTGLEHLRYLVQEKLSDKGVDYEQFRPLR